jgi:hypothetical protein
MMRSQCCSAHREHDAKQLVRVPHAQTDTRMQRSINMQFDAGYETDCRNRSSLLWQRSSGLPTLGWRSLKSSYGLMG